MNWPGALTIACSAILEGISRIQRGALLVAVMKFHVICNEVIEGMTWEGVLAIC